MGSSPGFASAARDCSPCSDSLSLRLASRLGLAAHRNSLAHSTKGTPSQPRGAAPTACGHAVSGAVSLPSRGAFHLSLTVLVHYRSQESVQAWRVVPPASHRVSRVRRYSGSTRQGAGLRVRGCDPVSPALPGRSAASRLSHCRVVGPTTPAAVASAPVWPGPLSLATTRGISFDFSSSGYLDVSVPPVAPRRPMCSAGGRRASSPGGFSHSETHGSCGHVPLAVDYRGLSRPSSASCAKASTVCPWYPSRRHRAGALRSHVINRA